MKRLPIRTVVASLLALFLGAAPAASLADRLPQQAVDTGEIPEITVNAADAGSKPLPFYQIAPDIYFLYGNIEEVNARNRGFNGNAGFVITREGVVVLDSLGSPKLGRRLIATIRKVTAKPIRYLILTHNHPDHSYGAIAFRKLPGIRIIGHQGTLDYLNSENLAGSVAFRRQIIPGDMRGFAGVRPDILVGGGLYSHYDFTLGGKTFKVYNADQHHSFGDLVVHQVEDGILWISDLAFSNRTTFMGDGHSRNALEAMDWLRRTFSNVRLMVPGHGSAQTAPFPMLDKTYGYVQRLREEMRRAVESGQDMESAVAASDFADWHGTRLYEENHKKNANFVYREMEQEVYFGK